MSFTGNHPDTLAGVRVLDLTRLLPGPFCTMLLADLGADIIKIEAPQGGDYARWYPPMFGKGASSVGAFFASINRGKRSIALNLKTDRGREIFLSLLDGADVVVESFRPGVMARLGLGPDTLRSRKPDIIYCAITGYGQSGEYRLRAGHDLNYLALVGAIEQTGTTEQPVIPGFQLADVGGGGLYGALSIISALHHRQRTGEGATLDISMTHGAMTFMAPVLAGIAAGGSLAPRANGQLTGALPCYRIYETEDGKFAALGALEPKFWSAFCHAVEHPEWIPLGHVHDSSIQAEVTREFRSRPRTAWVELAEQHDFCLEPVLDPTEVAASSPAKDAFFRLSRGGVETVQVATPVTPTSARLTLEPVPGLGEQTAEILREVGIEADSLDELRAAKVIG